MSEASWIDEFEFGLSRVRVKKTGAVLPYSSHLLADAVAWLRYRVAVQGEPVEPGPRFRICFAPDMAHPWYLIRPVLRLAGGVVARDPEAADFVFQFEDASVTSPLPPGGAAVRINDRALDVRKSVVAAAFEATFGYGLSVDPRAHHGPAVEKSEENGAHDGRIVECPMDPRPGRVYQRVVDNRCASRPGLVEDIRTPTIGGRPVLAYLKRRPVGSRFANSNAEVLLAPVEDHLSAAEIDQVGRFCARLGLDWGGLDILRDAADGRIYIVDANKTDMGPPLALPLAEKLASTRLLARRFRDFMNTAARD